MAAAAPGVTDRGTSSVITPTSASKSRQVLIDHESDRGPSSIPALVHQRIGQRIGQGRTRSTCVR
jgi:hypothetical protein